MLYIWGKNDLDTVQIENKVLAYANPFFRAKTETYQRPAKRTELGK